MKPEYPHHPGYDARSCEHHIIVTPAWGATTSSGYACGLSGGHCLPFTDKCPLTKAQQKSLRVAERGTESSRADRRQMEG